MQALTLPAGRGLRWLIEGFAIFQHKPALLSFLVLGYLLSTAVVSAVPVIGQWASVLLVPAFSVSLMNACRLIHRKEELSPQVLFSGFHRNLQTLFALGIIYVLVMLLVLGLSTLFGDGMSLRMPAMNEALDRGETPGPVSMSFSPLAIVLLIPVNMVFHFAPVLVAWHDMSAGKSLFFSLVACLRNWRPLLLYLLSLLAVALAGMFVLILLGSLFGEWLLATMAVVAISLVLLPTWYASFYISYRDIFVGQQDAL
ncbi:MAG: hypothetical protein LBQ62_03445 [Candidatus Accumulibacter sp.]|jgi:hypothetical protein|nr:hypothetical protein [Accumulibacter sp.]